MLYLVTLTGADDSVDPQQLIELSRQYPSVEWGILVSGKRYGTNRFPSLQWLEKLAKLLKENVDVKVNLACHLCGQYVRDLLLGDSEQMMYMMQRLFDIFQRVQINTHGEPHPYTEHFFNFMKQECAKRFILQYDNANYHLLVDAVRANPHVVTLYDMSHGAGVSPHRWPQGHLLVQNGYAGGLGPDNVELQVHRIAQVAGKRDFWIDMETKVRSDDDKLFDLDKCRTVLELTKPFTQV